MEFESYFGKTVTVEPTPVSLDLSLEDLDGILEHDVYATVPPDEDINQPLP